MDDVYELLNMFPNSYLNGSLFNTGGMSSCRVVLSTNTDDCLSRGIMIKFIFMAASRVRYLWILLIRELTANYFNS